MGGLPCQSQPLTKMRDTFHDLETYSPEPINNGSHRYAEKAEVLLWAYADGNGATWVWDAANGYGTNPPYFGQ